MANLQTIWTYTLKNEVLTITSDFNFTKLSFILISGKGTYLGGLTANAIPSTPCNLLLGQSVELDISSFSIIDSITLDTTPGGVIHIIGRG